ncbi:hypothetical protein B0H67DRAFT_516433 [Lasiosphaeris hirsuta]|uniref:Uncharacterized protein n=1 Tax=Lasiosphaeris hirsuta TaxID=260670 RepID=A0AA40DSY4_9PEZI|nr:hypothetical protein B0H67DRAFT_516433 [Lasiosphaeris hirsuta]
MKSSSSLLIVVAALFGLASGEKEQPEDTPGAAQAAIISDNFVCQHPPYKVQLVSTSPLVIYLKGFLTEAERTHLKAVGKSTFNSTPTKTGPHSIYIPRDAVVECIEERTLAFQGYASSHTHLEPFQLDRHTPDTAPDEPQPDWFADQSYRLAENGGNRISSLHALVHVAPDIADGGINFPLLNAPRDEHWCDVVNCDGAWEEGVTFRPVEGNAVYWENLDADGSGREEVVKRGLPVAKGEKIGLNIWTRQGVLSNEIREKYGYPSV